MSVGRHLSNTLPTLFEDSSRLRMEYKRYRKKTLHRHRVRLFFSSYYLAYKSPLPKKVLREEGNGHGHNDKVTHVDQLEQTIEQD